MAPHSNEVLYTMIENLSNTVKDFIAETKESHKSQDEKQEKILENVIKTNGRVTSLEGKSKEYGVEIDDYKTRRANFSGVSKLWAVIGTGVIAIVSYFWFIYMQNFKNEIVQELAPQVSETVYQRLEKEYDIQVK